ncbi:MAG: WYL domain-containing protein [Atopobiaceae bacterium]|nr:WYL domain-containing protein [Atopobiaceae bacterium]
MALDTQRIEEYAALLPRNLSCTDARERMLCVLEILQTCSDHEHPLTNRDIRGILRARFGDAGNTAENTIARDIKALKVCGALGLDIRVGPLGVSCESTRLGYQQVRMLLNAAQSSRTLSHKQASELQTALSTLVSCHQDESLIGEVLVEQRSIPSQQVLKNLDIISEALRTHKKISFTYHFTDFDGKLGRPLEGDPLEGSSDLRTTRVETPVALIYSGKFYYLESYSNPPWRHGRTVLRSRIDRMMNVEISDEKADNCDEVKQARKTAVKRIETSFDMIDGKTHTILLRATASSTNALFDSFGKLTYIDYTQAEEDSDRAALTCVNITASFAFYKWLAGFDGKVLLEEPKALSFAQYQQAWKNILRDKGIVNLQSDYREVREGYLEFLNNARAPYL